jgi:hypothetical protein
VVNLNVRDCGPLRFASQEINHDVGNGSSFRGVFRRVAFPTNDVLRVGVPTCMVLPGFISLLGTDNVWGCEFRDTGVAAGNPAEYVHLCGVGQAVGDGVGNDFQQRVSTQVLEVVDVRLDLDAVYPADGLDIFLVEGELDIRLAELNLLKAACCVGMEEAGVGFWSKLPLHGRAAHLVDNGFICVSKEAVLCERLVP